MTSDDAERLAHEFAIKFGLREGSTFPQAVALERDLATFLRVALAPDALDALIAIPEIRAIAERCLDNLRATLDRVAQIRAEAEGIPEVLLDLRHPYTCATCRGEWPVFADYKAHLPTCPRDRRPVRRG